MFLGRARCYNVIQRRRRRRDLRPGRGRGEGGEERDREGHCHRGQVEGSMQSAKFRSGSFPESRDEGGVEETGRGI